ncbi:hypothetical protein LCGC14_2896030, partial [marine sediment metagenome]
TQNQIRVDIDERNESVGKRIREAETEWIPYILVIGEREVNAKNLNVRDRELGSVTEIPFDEFVNKIKDKTKDKPFSKLNFPRNVSSRPQIMV